MSKVIATIRANDSAGSTIKELKEIVKNLPEDKLQAPFNKKNTYRKKYNNNQYESFDDYFKDLTEFEINELKTRFGIVDMNATLSKLQITKKGDKICAVLVRTLRKNHPPINQY